VIQPTDWSLTALIGLISLALVLQQMSFNRLSCLLDRMLDTIVEILDDEREEND
jgi:hypothetical protein